MYSALSYDLMQARAARGVRRPQSGHSARSRPAVTARRVLAVLTARGA
jgi:hypothetical protein